MAASPDGGETRSMHIRELETALDAIRDYAIITLNADGTVTSWNHGSEAMRGFTAAEVIGQPVSLFYTPEDRESRLAERELQAARDAGRFEAEGWRIRKDGSRFWANVVVVPVRGDDGTVTGFVKATRDVTEQKRAESLFQGLLESAPDAMIITGGDGRIELVNRQAELLFGYSREELAGREVEMLIPGRFRDRHPAYRAGYAAAPRARPMGADLELWGLRRDGTEFPVEISLSPLETPDQGLLVAAAIRDVTERRETELRLQHQRDEILELSTPVIQVWDKVLALPIIGTLDSVRAARLTEGLLTQIGEHQAEVIIMDISGVPAIDTQVAQHLLRTVQAATLMGATSILCGVRPETAQAMVHLGIDMGQLRSRTTLRDALQLAMQMLRERAGAADAAAEAAASGRGLT
jgi:rsbT co-antagonist protein RsbR